MRALTCNAWLDLPFHAASIASSLGEGDRQQGYDKPGGGVWEERGKGEGAATGGSAESTSARSGCEVVVWSVGPANRSVLLRAHENGGRRRRNERAADVTPLVQAQQEEGEAAKGGGERRRVGRRARS